MFYRGADFAKALCRRAAAGEALPHSVIPFRAARSVLLIKNSIAKNARILNCHAGKSPARPPGFLLCFFPNKLSELRQNLTFSRLKVETSLLQTKKNSCYTIGMA
jgi:hypothetical protein